MGNQGLWQYHAVFTQTNAGGGNVIANFTIPAGSRLELLSVVIGTDDYAAGRTVKMYIKDVSDRHIVMPLTYAGVSIDNVFLFWPHLGEAVAADKVTTLRQKYLLGPDEYLYFLATALVQNETFSIGIRGLITGVKPTITTTGSTGTVSTTTTHNRVV